MSGGGGCGRRRRLALRGMVGSLRWSGRRGSRSRRCCGGFRTWTRVRCSIRVGCGGRGRERSRFWSASRGLRRLWSVSWIRPRAAILSRRCGGHRALRARAPIHGVAMQCAERQESPRPQVRSLRCRVAGRRRGPPNGPPKFRAAAADPRASGADALPEDLAAGVALVPELICHRLGMDREQYLGSLAAG